PNFSLHLGRDDLGAAHKHAGKFRRLGFDRDRQDRVGRATGHDVKDSQPLLKPRIAPGLDHRGGLFFVKSLPDESLFKLAGQRFDCWFGPRPTNRRFTLGGAVTPPARSASAVLEENDFGDLVRPGAADYHLIIFQSGRERKIEKADAAIEKKPLLLDLLFIAE